MLSPNGVATFITTNYYHTALGARKLRADIKERMRIRTLFNLGELRLFENAPGQHNMISSFTKGKDDYKCQVIDVHQKGTLNPLMFTSIINHIDEDTTYADIAQEDLYDGEENYIRLQNSSVDNPLSSLLEKIASGNEALGNIAEVNAGIMGGCDSITNHNMKYADADYIQCNDIRKDDGVFVLDCSYFRASDTMQLVQNYPFYKDFYKNSDISRYCTNEATTKRLIFSSSDTPLSEQEIIKSCLAIYQPILTRIRETNNEKREYWHQLRRGTAHPHIFTGAKIVCPQRSKSNTFGYNECDWYASADVYYITRPKEGYNIKYILALLNSRLYYIWLYNKGKRKGETLELYQKPLSEIPIKKAAADIQERIAGIVDEIMALKKENPNNDTSALERKVDAAVYEIYGLSSAEIAAAEQ
jgi:adenine-specific DNA-methyltransferase